MQRVRKEGEKELPQTTAAVEHIIRGLEISIAGRGVIGIVNKGEYDWTQSEIIIGLLDEEQEAIVQATVKFICFPDICSHLLQQYSSDYTCAIILDHDFFIQPPLPHFVLADIPITHAP